MCCSEILHKWIRCLFWYCLYQNSPWYCCVRHFAQLTTAKSASHTHICQLFFGTYIVAIVIRHHSSILVWIRTPLVHKDYFDSFRWWSSSLNILFITAQIWIKFIKMAGMPELGSKISLISKADIRYEGQLFTVDPNECTIALANGK